MYKPIFNKREVIVFRQFQRKGYSLFACLGRVVVISVLSVATLSSATAATDDISTKMAAATDDEATDKEATLDDVEITGSRAPLALGQAARMVTVLSREDIQAAPVQSINDLLKYAVGVDVRQRGPLGAQTDIGIRGSTQEQITILLDGINICDPQTGHNAFDLPVDISEIERIEVLEGPAGRVYGTSSLVGAINVVTRGNERNERNEGNERNERNEGNGKWRAQMRMEGGFFGYLSAGGCFSHFSSTTSHSPRFDNHLSASLTRSEGYSRSKNGHLNSDYRGCKAFYRGTYEDDDLKLNWHAGMSSRGFGSNTFYSAKFDEQFEQTTKFFTAIQAETSAEGLHVKPAIYWNRSYDRFELIRGSEDMVPFNHHRTDVMGVNLNSYFDWQLGRTAFGAEMRSENIVSGNLGEPLDNPDDTYKLGLKRSQTSFHLEHNVLLRHFTLSAGFIATKNSWNDMPFHLYPGIDASYRLDDHWKIYASYNSSLRLPSFTELYYSVGGHKADKYLKPEEMKALEGGVKYLSKAFTAQASVYHHHCENMIDWRMDPTATNPVWESVNFTKVNTLGVELQANVDLEKLFRLKRSTFNIAYCYIDQNKADDHQMLTQSKLEYLRHKLVASLRLALTERLDLSVKYRLQKRAGDYTTPTGEVKPYATYEIVDSRLAWNADRYIVFMEANNLLGRHYVDYGNVPQPGAWFIFGTTLRLN